MKNEISNNQKTSVVTRFAPSPTGLLQAGNYRTALFSYTYARQNNGTFILRIENTDKERSKKEYEENILESLKWLGLEYDKFYRQSDRGEIYKNYLSTLIERGVAYISKEKPEKEGDREEVIRFKNPNKKVTFHDLIRGDITFDTTELGDFVIAKSKDEPVFHFTVVIDDFEMGITHVIRGEDHISNTPRHILIMEAIGAPVPTFAHLPLLLAPDRTKLSKRKGAKAITQYMSEGYLPEAVVNYLALLGWNPGNDKEIMGKEEIIKNFRLEKVQKGGAIFNEEKLKWFNKEYIRKMSQADLFEKIRAFTNESSALSDELLKKIAPLIVDRISRFSEIKEMEKRGELKYFITEPIPQKEILSWKGKEEPKKTAERLLNTAVLFEAMSEKDFTAENTKKAVWEFAEREGKGEVLWPMRVSLSGLEKSPDPFTIAEILGKNETVRRLKNTAQFLLELVSKNKRLNL